MKTVLTVEPSEAERPLFGQLLEQLEAPDKGRAPAGPSYLRGQDGNDVELPPSLYCVLHELVTMMAEGSKVSVVQSDAELTTSEAGDLLNVSRPHVVKLIEQGRLPSAKVGSKRRLRLSDVLTYRELRDAERQRTVRRLIAAYAAEDNSDAVTPS